MSLHTANGCEFCGKLANPARAWYDFNIVDEDAEFVAVASLGSLTPGMTLIVSRSHLPSMAELDPAQRSSLYDFERRLSGLMATLWQHPIVFEHGSGLTGARSSGPCIDHAHWHLIPGEYKLDDPKVPLAPADSFDQVAAACRGQAYLAWRNLSGAWRSGAVTVPGQYFRRLIADQLGRPDEWDYLAFPMLDNVRETILKFTGHDPA